MDEKDIVSSIAAHNQRNDSLSKQLTAKKVDFKRIRFIECHFWTPDKSAADRLAARLAPQGFSVLASGQAAKPDGKNDWNLELVIDKPLKEALSAAFTENLVRAAAGESGIYDGWGTEL